MLFGVYGLHVIATMGFWRNRLPILALHYTSLEQLLLAYQALLEMEALTEPELVTLCAQLPIHYTLSHGRSTPQALHCNQGLLAEMKTVHTG